MISTTLLETRLKLHGFVAAYRDDEVSEIIFIRNRSNVAFDRIRLNLSVDGRTASVGIEVSIVPGRTALKSLCVHRCLVEVATDVKRGVTPLSNDDSVTFLFGRIADIAPHACDMFAIEELNGLLRETASAREASQKYLELIEMLGVSKIATHVSMEAQKEIDRILQQRFVCIPGGRCYYELAIQAIAVGCGRIEGDDKWLVGRDADSSEDRGLMIRLQIMASRLAGERGWDFHIAGGAIDTEQWTSREQPRRQSGSTPI